MIALNLAVNCRSCIVIFPGDNNDHFLLNKKCEVLTSVVQVDLIVGHTAKSDCFLQGQQESSFLEKP